MANHYARNRTFCAQTFANLDCPNTSGCREPVWGPRRGKTDGKSVKKARASCGVFPDGSLSLPMIGSNILLDACPTIVEHARAFLPGSRMEASREKAENGMGNGAKSGSLSMSILLVDCSWDVHFQVGFWRETRWRALSPDADHRWCQRGHARRSGYAGRHEAAAYSTDWSDGGPAMK